MSSDVSICNLALSHLGDEANISSLSEQSVQAEHCNRFYPIARRLMLEMHTWSFSTRRIALASAAVEPPDSWAYAYTLPSKYLKAWAVLMPESANDDYPHPFTIEIASDDTRVLYTNVENATLRYSVDTENVNLFTEGFVVALSHLLASYLAGPIIKGREGMTVAQGQLQWFDKKAFPQAAAADSNMQQSDAYDTFTPSGLAARA